MKRIIILIVWLMLAAILAACQAPTPTPLAPKTREPSKTIIPTSTLWPTIPPVRTITDIPATATIAPSEPLTDFFTGVKIIRTDDFDTLNNWMLWNEESVSLSNGLLELQGQQNWNSGLVFNKKLNKGNGVVVTYKTAKNLDSQSEFVFVTGEFQTEPFRQFGIYNGKTPKADLYQGLNGLGFNYLHGNFSLKADTWYTLLMAVGENGEFIAVIYNPNNPSQQYIYHETLGEKWGDINWEFRITANTGETIYMDNFMQFTFSDFN